MKFLSGRNVLFVLLAIAIVAGAVIYFLKTPTKPQPQAQKTSLANPASVNCEKKGGTLAIKTNGNGGQYGLCQFEDNYACEEWAMFRGDCPVGGVRTTGFDNIEQQYCAWVGGQTLAVPNATCTFKDGSKCSDEELYNNGTCPAETNN